MRFVCSVIFLAIFGNSAMADGKPVYSKQPGMFDPYLEYRGEASVVLEGKNLPVQVSFRSSPEGQNPRTQQAETAIDCKAPAREEFVAQVKDPENTKLIQKTLGGKLNESHRRDKPELFARVRLKRMGTGKTIDDVKYSILGGNLQLLPGVVSEKEGNVATLSPAALKGSGMRAMEHVVIESVDHDLQPGAFDIPPLPLNKICGELYKQMKKMQALDPIFAKPAKGTKGQAQNTRGAKGYSSGAAAPASHPESPSGPAHNTR